MPGTIEFDESILGEMSHEWNEKGTKRGRAVHEGEWRVVALSIPGLEHVRPDWWSPEVDKRGIVLQADSPKEVYLSRRDISACFVLLSRHELLLIALGPCLCGQECWLIVTDMFTHGNDTASTFDVETISAVKV